MGKKYFAAWKSDMTIQDRHRFDIHTYHEHYEQFLNLPSLHTRLRIKIAAIALIETFEACLSDPNCSLADHSYLTKSMLLPHGFDAYAEGDLEICRKLMNIFAKISNKNDLLWVIEADIPYLY